MFFDEPTPTHAYSNHRPHFINRLHILRARSKRGRWRLTMSDQHEVPVGETYQQAFLQSLAETEKNG